MTFFVILAVHSIFLYVYIVYCSYMYVAVAMNSTISGLFHLNDDNKLFAHIRNV